MTCRISPGRSAVGSPRPDSATSKRAGTGLTSRGATLAIGGTSYPWGPRFDPCAIPDADFRLLLSHTPDRFPTAARHGIDLVLSGHNHAGQVRFPLVGPVFMPSLYSRRFDRGFFRSGRTLLYVSQGIAGKHPIRYGGCEPEITRLVLRVVRPVATSAAIGDGCCSEIHTTIINIPLNEHDGEHQDGQRPPPLLPAGPDRAAASDGVVADLDLVPFGLRHGRTLGDQPPRCDVALARIEKVDRER